MPDPGYYPDPENPGMERWWNGQGWSDARRYTQTPESKGPSWRDLPVRITKFKEGTSRNKAIGTAILYSLFPVAAVVPVFLVRFPLSAAIMLTIVGGALAYGAWTNALKIPR